ncbi:hypothetical protein B4N89_02330 [Embleya scabrispora]|uniref:Uncharacterized protein n=1 Tax=Embleya scabrispora TaxID=159449 RepID=A0A1T3NT58_9ACTN|nr:hypothetical protein [Embleya scabrispora]OPC79935.1 hypothetical protein B4N89_02330 [Embleya scabrispora]
MSTPTDGARITALGRTIPLTDGSTAHVRYSLRSMAHLEARYGSLAQMQEVFDQIQQASASMDRPMIAPIIDILGAGLLDDGFVPHARERVTVVRRTSPDGAIEQRDEREVVEVTYVRQRDRRELASLLDMHTFEAVAMLMSEALSEAMPAPAVAAGGAQPSPLASTLNLPSSPGANFTTSGSSPLADLIASSGC